MRKAKAARRPIRYLLSADWGHHKISLKKISERFRKAKRGPRSSRSRRPGTKNSTPFPLEISSRAIVLGIMCIVAAVALTTARQPSRGADAARVEVETAPEARGPVERATATPRLEAVPTVASKPRPKAAASETPAPVSTKKAPTVEPVEAPSPAPVKPLGSAPVTQTAAATKAPLALAPTTAPPGSKTESDDDPDAAPVTITGCLERDESAFWLKKTSGTDAPKSRSWKFGFLKKRSAPIELVDPHDTLRLTNYVGRRIAATGTLVDRELRTRSIRQVKAVCN